MIPMIAQTEDVTTKMTMKDVRRLEVPEPLRMLEPGVREAEGLRFLFIF